MLPTGILVCFDSLIDVVERCEPIGCRHSVPVLMTVVLYCQLGIFSRVVTLDVVSDIIDGGSFQLCWDCHYHTNFSDLWHWHVFQL